jgi:hypothetical protein
MKVSLYTPDDAIRISRFVRKYFQPDKTQENRSYEPEYYSWKYAENPAGMPIARIMEEGAEVAGLFAVVPKRIKLGSQNIIGYEMVDGMLAPHLQGKGIFAELVDSAFDEVKGREGYFLYGMPNDRSYPVFIHAYGFIEPFRIRWLVRPMNPSNILDSKIKLGFLNKILGYGAEKLLEALFPVKRYQDESNGVFKRMCSVDTEVASFWDTISREYGFALVKDNDYLNWRYIDNPDQYEIYELRLNGELQGLVFLKYGKARKLKVGFISDILTRRYDVRSLKTLMNHTFRIFDENGVDIVSCEVPAGDFFYKTLRKFGFINASKNHHIIVNGSHHTIASLPKSPSEWLLFPGDADDI